MKVNQSINSLTSNKLVEINQFCNTYKIKLLYSGCKSVHKKLKETTDKDNCIYFTNSFIDSEDNTYFVDDS